MKTIKCLIVLAVAVSISACASTKTSRSFGESVKDSYATSSIKWKLGRDKTVKAGQVNVDTWKKEITLTGRVATEEEKARAEEIARNYKGVTTVYNHIQVVGVEPENGKTGIEETAVKEPKKNSIKAPVEKLEEPPVVSESPKKRLPKEQMKVETAKLQDEALNDKSLIDEESADDNDGVSHQIKKDLASTEADDITREAENELKELKARKASKKR